MAEPDEAQPVAGRPELEHSPPPATGSRGRAVGILAAVALVLVLVDVLTKELAASRLDPDVPVRLLGGALYLSLTRNSGAAFSLFRDHTFIFPLITLAVIGWIGWMARQLRSVPWAVSLGLVLGGAAGNLIDRVFRAPGPFQGHVVDFLSLFDPYGDVWPIFNVADMALVTGVCLAILLEMKGRHRDGSRLRQPERDSAPGDPADSAAAVHSDNSSVQNRSW